MEQHLPENLVSDYKEAFHTLDHDQDGKISLSVGEFQFTCNLKKLAINQISEIFLLYFL